ncbi:hypothetical protein [Pelagibacterium lacus]|uniref:hypothetical protein n=1 Tax=Pelagibacterium lacus TaxID=2282655 RepID=UPI0011C01DA9|nr:hypothetical protein [Pelagibacterium lacus]
MRSAIAIYGLAKQAVGQIGAIFTDANSCYHLAFARIGANEPHWQTKAETHLIESSNASFRDMLELIARTFPFRHDANELYARTTFSLAAAEEDYTPESDFDRDTDTELARGEEEPLLGIPALGRPKDGK